ncbi:MAG: polyribonucleotide nucleotidyltransferase [bacterium]|nr:polyribonucleotide nucleotidyltransferase [bacterium]
MNDHLFSGDSFKNIVSTKKYSRSLDGKEFIIELNNWAEQASGSVLVRLGDTLVLATAVMNPNPREGMDYFPLSVEYEEKFYATGKILGSRFIKRETRPSEEAILAGRFIDRSIRPRFDHRMRNEVQIVVTVLSIDDQNDPDVPGLLAASLALGISNIPWNGPIAGIRVGINEGKMILNPATNERNSATLDMIVSGTGDRINMIEAGANEIPEETFAEAVEWGFNFIKELINFQQDIIKENGLKKTEVPLLEAPAELQNLLKEKFWDKIESAVYQRDKKDMHSALAVVKEEWLKSASEANPDSFKKGPVDLIFDKAVDEIVHKKIIEKGERPDGRKPDELRELKAEVGILPRVHGSAIFMRGQTHALATLTLGAPGDEQIIEGMEVRTKKKFLLHYNFPPYSVGEVKPMRGPGRREIGHGALAGKALLPLLPNGEDFPYTMRVVSEILSSNGSSSMASVCGASLALMDAGVPIKKHAAGAAMGLMLNKKGEYKVLTDIQGPEDHHGDMDFKVAGTRDGITAVQMDVKIEGITHVMLRDTLKQSLKARLEILNFMESVLDKPRPELSPWAPRVTTLKINPEKIGALIGPGGKMINGIIAETGVQIDINDDGTVFVTSVTKEGMEKALALIKQTTRELKAGDLLEGRVTRILDFGAMVEVGPRQDGLIHISELAPWRVERVTDILNIGDVVPVKIKNIDEQGRVNLSLKDVPGKYSEEDIEKGRAESRQNNDLGGPRGPRRGGDHRRR